jgi:hypothetical protein
MNKLFLKEGNFYITNVCNLTCEHCITYNNFKFSGHYFWKDYKDMFVEWSKKIDIGDIGIIGGEPFANPDLINWTIGIKELWPDSKEHSISTNGTYIKHRIPEIRELIKLGIWLDICVHDPVHYEEIKISLLEAISIFPNISTHRASDVAIDYYSGFTHIARLYTTFAFARNSIKDVKNRIIYMHNSDPVKAHGRCGLCHYFVRGNLFKCYLTSIGQDLVEQLPIDHAAREKLTSYRSCSPYDDDSFVKGFLDTIEMPISQCSLCPETPIMKPIWPLAQKKLKL